MKYFQLTGTGPSTTATAPLFVRPGNNDAPGLSELVRRAHYECLQSRRAFGRTNHKQSVWSLVKPVRLRYHFLHSGFRTSNSFVAPFFQTRESRWY